MEKNYNSASVMNGGFPKIRKMGAVSPNGESTPFVWNGRLMRLELADPAHGTDANCSLAVKAIIRNTETGNIISSFGEGCYYYSAYQEDGKLYVIGTVSKIPGLSGDSFRIFESSDLKSWKSRKLLSNEGWNYFNTSLTKGPDGYVLLMEANKPVEYAGEHPFTLFFAVSKDMVHWEFMDYDRGFSKDRYMGGPYLRYSNGWYYLISVTELPCSIYTNYIYRTKDFIDWEVGKYNPILMPSEDDRLISPHAYDLSDELLSKIPNGYISSNSDIDLCEFNGKTIISYNVGNQLGYYYMAEAVYDGTLDEFFEAYFN